MISVDTPISYPPHAIRCLPILSFRLSNGSECSTAIQYKNPRQEIIKLKLNRRGSISSFVCVEQDRWFTIETWQWDRIRYYSRWQSEDQLQGRECNRDGYVKFMRLLESKLRTVTILDKFPHRTPVPDIRILHSTRRGEGEPSVTSFIVFSSSILPRKQSPTYLHSLNNTRYGRAPILSKYRNVHVIHQWSRCARCAHCFVKLRI